MSQQQSVSVETVKAILDAFNAHGLDAIMEFFADDCSLDMPRRPDPWGQRYVARQPSERGWRPASRVARTSTMATTAIGSVGVWLFRSGC
jgi:ketosteroid isomerase-like protein